MEGFWFLISTLLMYMEKGACEKSVAPPAHSTVPWLGAAPPAQIPIRMLTGVWG